MMSSPLSNKEQDYRKGVECSETTLGMQRTSNMALKPLFRTDPSTMVNNESTTTKDTFPSTIIRSSSSQRKPWKRTLPSMNEIMLRARKSSVLQTDNMEVTASVCAETKNTLETETSEVLVPISMDIHKEPIGNEKMVLLQPNPSYLSVEGFQHTSNQQALSAYNAFSSGGNSMSYVPGDSSLPHPLLSRQFRSLYFPLRASSVAPETRTISLDGTSESKSEVLTQPSTAAYMPCLLPPGPMNKQNMQQIDGRFDMPVVLGRAPVRTKSVPDFVPRCLQMNKGNKNSENTNLKEGYPATMHYGGNGASAYGGFFFQRSGNAMSSVDTATDPGSLTCKGPSLPSVEHETEGTSLPFGDHLRGLRFSDMQAHMARGEYFNIRSTPIIPPPQRKRWTTEEHEKFLEGLSRYGRKWKKIQAYVKTKTAVQVRTHAYGYFSKLLRNMPDEEEVWEIAKTMSCLPTSVIKGPGSNKRGKEPRTDEAGMSLLRKYVFTKGHMACCGSSCGANLGKTENTGVVSKKFAEVVDEKRKADGVPPPDKMEADNACEKTSAYHRTANLDNEQVDA